MTGSGLTDRNEVLGQQEGIGGLGCLHAHSLSHYITLNLSQVLSEPLSSSEQLDLHLGIKPFPDSLGEEEAKFKQRNRK